MRPRNDQNTGAKAFIGVCPSCGKRSYPSKADAKKAVRQLHKKHGGHLSVYRCGTAWHFGHLPAAVRAGDATRDEIRPVTRRNPR